MTVLHSQHRVLAVAESNTNSTEPQSLLSIVANNVFNAMSPISASLTGKNIRGNSTEDGESSNSSEPQPQIPTNIENLKRSVQTPADLLFEKQLSSELESTINTLGQQVPETQPQIPTNIENLSSSAKTPADLLIEKQSSSDLESTINTLGLQVPGLPYSPPYIPPCPLTNPLNPLLPIVIPVVRPIEVVPIPVIPIVRPIEVVPIPVIPIVRQCR